jgi:hypothetical protein
MPHRIPFMPRLFASLATQMAIAKSMRMPIP